MFAAGIVAVLALAVVSSAKTVNIFVGNSTNATNPFNPPNVTAEINDIVLFTFVAGEFDVVQSTFAGPCIHAHESNASIAGFDSGVQPATNTSHPTFPVTVTNNDTIWFYTTTLCAEGGVGGININESSTATLEGFERNAIRLNGTDANQTTTTGPTSTAPPSSSSSTTSSTTTSTGGNSGERITPFGVVPMVLLALGISVL